ncbi:MAG: hypothetical protein JNJ54_33105 [Myxococcaceae bacterium]|nr:hypothetical protein [Myxococcaceae bacterium]
MRALTLAALGVALVACEKHPKTITVHRGAFQLTVPAGWSSSEEAQPTFDHVSITPPGGDGACTFAFTDTSSEPLPAQYEENFRTSAMKALGATSATPDSLEISGARFGGAHFKGRPPASGVVGVLATLAGEASVETYGGAIGKTYVGVMFTTFETTGDPKAVLDGCRAVARSLDALSTRAGGATMPEHPPRRPAR